MPKPKGFNERPGFSPELKLDVGQEIVGKIIAYKLVKLTEKGGRIREQPMIQLETDRGRWSFWLGSNLADRITSADVDRRVWIERLADEPIEGQPSPMKAYNCAVEA